MTISHLDRRLSRLAVVQALYQMDMAQTDIDTIVTQYTCSTNRPVIGEHDTEMIESDQDMDTEFFNDLVRGVVKQQKNIDSRISHLLAKGWSLQRLDSILRAILRAGAYEILYRPDVPPKSVITEYLEISHGYFGEDEPKMINGILDKLALEIQN